MLCPDVPLSLHARPPTCGSAIPGRHVSQVRSPVGKKHLEPLSPDVCKGRAEYGLDKESSFSALLEQ